MASAADVPGKFDIVIDGEGYMLADWEEVKAQYGFTPPFVPRSNTQGDYGDNFQDFWLTHTQRDWSKGEDQRYFRSVEGRDARYFLGTSVDISIPGEVTIGARIISTSALAASAVTACVARNLDSVAFATSTRIYTISAGSVVTDRNVHTLGVSPRGMCSDGNYLFVSSTEGGSAGVRSWDGTNYATFSASGADSICFLNNTLFGFRNDNGKLVKWDSSGTQSDVFQWKNSAGGAQTGIKAHMVAYGGKLAILLSGEPLLNGPELWIFDGVAPAKVAHLGKGVTITASTQSQVIEVVNGMIVVGAEFTRAGAFNSIETPFIWYYANGNSGVLWRSETTGPTSTSEAPRLQAFQDGLLFTDHNTLRIRFYNFNTGGVSSLGATTLTSFKGAFLVAADEFVAAIKGTSAEVLYCNTGVSTTFLSATAIVYSSLLDFDSSLEKIFRGITVDWDGPNGSSIDISYAVDQLTTYTSLQVGATSGVEYPISGVSGRSISVMVTLNKGTGNSTSPRLRRVYTRAVPKQATFRKEQIVLNLTGKDGESSALLRDQMHHPKDGLTQAIALRSVATTAEAVSITDEFGTFTGVIEELQLRRIRPQEFIAIVSLREV